MPQDRRPVIYDENLNFFRNFILQVRLVWLLFRDRRVPLWLKMLPIGSIVYLFSPLDFLPDTIPVLTQLDDLAVLLIGFRLFIDMCPAEVVAEHMQTLTGRSAWEVEPKPGRPPEVEADSEKLETKVIDGKFTEPPEE